MISPYIYDLSYIFLTEEIGFSDKLVREYIEEGKKLQCKKMRIYKYEDLSKEVDQILELANKQAQLYELHKDSEEISNKVEKINDENSIKNKNSKTKEKINLDIDEYEIIRGEWNSIMV